MHSFKKRVVREEKYESDMKIQQSPGRVSTPVHIDKLTFVLGDYPDRSFVRYLLDGLENGFFTGLQSIPKLSFECKHLLSSRAHPEITKELVNTEVKKGFMIGPFTEIPYAVYRVNPTGIAEGKYSKKKRIIVDLSAPHNNDEHMSLNDLISKADFPLNYVTIDQAVNIIRKRGRGSWLCKTDITDAFKIMPIHTLLWPFLVLSA